MASDAFFKGLFSLSNKRNFPVCFFSSVSYFQGTFSTYLVSWSDMNKISLMNKYYLSCLYFLIQHHNIYIIEAFIKMSHKKSEAQYLQLENSNSRIQLNTKPECRICLEDDNDGTQQIRAPCKCEGSVKYLHLKCLKKWIIEGVKSKTQTQVEQMLAKGTPCQICKHPIFFDLNMSLSCETCEENKKKISGKKTFFGLMIMMTIVVLGAMAYSVYEVLQQIQQYGTLESLKSILMVSLVGILAILLGFMVYFFIIQFFLVVDHQVGEIRKLVNGKQVKLTSITDTYSSNIQIENIQ